jgi:hypothetical protein
MTKRTLAATVVAMALLSPAAAGAQPTNDGVRAEALFDAAKRLRDAGQYADACPQFAESARLAPGVGVSLYLADCYERVGKTGSAWTEFHKAEKLAHERNDDRRANLARARALALEPKLNGLTIAVPPAVAQEGPEVMLDGARPIPPEEWNQAIAVDPGDHVVTANVRGRALQTLTAHFDAGTRAATVQVEGSVSTAAPAPPAEPAPTAPPVQAAPPDPGATRRWLGIGLLGAGAVGISIGTAILLNTNQSSSGVASCAPQPQDQSATIGSTIAFAAGGVALLAGLGLSVTAPNKPGVGITAGPLLVAGGGGAVLEGGF